MRLQNIYNYKKDVYLFTRGTDGTPKIIKDDTVSPYFFVPDLSGNHLAYDGGKLKKILLTDPKEVRKFSTPDSYESDLPFTQRYVIDKIEEFSPCKLRYMFFDIEVKSSGDGDINAAKDPISCITTYDSFTQEYEQFFLLDYENEKALLDDFVNYVRAIQPDMLLAWYIDFDYGYLCKRVKNFGKKISPIGKDRWQKEGNSLPAGIAIVDYLKLFKKINMKEPSYKLDDITEKFLGHGKVNKKVDFSIVDETLKARNLEDVKLMVQLEKQEEILPYYDEVRRLCKVNWEDLYYNSRIIESLLFKEAKEKGVILPNKKDAEKVEFQGAARGLRKPGVFKNIVKYDLSGAYPSMITNFCIDTTNIRAVATPNTVEIDGINFEQDLTAIIPAMVKKIVTLKTNIGERKANTTVGTEEHKKISKLYDAIKGIVNSGYGALGNQYFRLYDSRLTSTITYLVRELLLYCRDRLEEMGYPVVYWDTDALFVDTQEDLYKILNDLIQEWGVKKYNKAKIEMTFDYEGMFTQILILGKCHYYAHIKKSNGKIVPEVKGVEMKRSSSSKFEAKFQEELFEKVLAGDSKNAILSWVSKQQDRMKTCDLSEVGFPTKISMSKKYKSVPIFVRAVANTKSFDPRFKVKKGELFHYLFIDPLGSDENLKSKNVLAFTPEDMSVINKYKNRIDWTTISNRSILAKSEAIFNALGWDIGLTLSGQTTLF